LAKKGGKGLNEPQRGGEKVAPHPRKEKYFIRSPAFLNLNVGIK
jgi:hypothetical protein